MSPVWRMSTDPCIAYQIQLQTAPNEHHFSKSSWKAKHIRENILPVFPNKFVKTWSYISIIQWKWIKQLTYRKSYFHQVLKCLVLYSLRSKNIHVGTKITFKNSNIQNYLAELWGYKTIAFSFTSQQIRLSLILFIFNLDSLLRALFYSVMVTGMG